MTADPPATPPPSPSAWRWWVCGLLFLATTLNYMDRIALNQMSLRIMEALRLDEVGYGWLESGFSFAFAVGAVLSGVVVDKVHVRWVYPVMVFGWSVAGFLTGYAAGFWSLLACRVALGLFEAGNWPCGIRTTRAVMKPEERSFGNSLFQSGTAIGAIVTPFLLLGMLRWADPGEAARNAAAAAGGGAYIAAANAPRDIWQVPFQLIGLIGFGWIALWFLTVPGKLLAPAAPGAAHPAAHEGAARYRDVFADRRFWALMVMVVAVNIAWHTYRAWLPLYLQKARGLSEAQMAGFMTWFYVVADIGSWTVGLVTLLLVRRGVGGHAARLLVFFLCAVLALVSLAVPFAPSGPALTAAVLVFAFAALGLFPTYFALSQDLSSRHQGKVTGTLGASAHLALSLAVYPIEARVIKPPALAPGEVPHFDLVLAAAGVFPLLAFLLMWWLWPPPKSAPAA